MGLELFFAAAIACTDLGPIQGREYEVSRITNLGQYMIFRRFDFDGDGHADLMTGHRILADEFQMREYIDLAKKGDLKNVLAEPQPLFYWLDVTGKDSWDRIYVDIAGNGRCDLYASQDRTS